VQTAPAPGSGGGSSDTTTDDGPSNTGSGDSTSSTEPVYPAEPIVGPVYYVAPYGDDSRSKAQAANPSTPWRTLQYERYFTIEGNLVHDSHRLPDPDNWEKFDWGMYLKGHGHVVKNNIFFANIGGADLRIDGDIGDSPAPPNDERAFVVMNNTFAGSTTGNKRQISLFRNGSGHTPRNVLIMNNVFWDAEDAPPIWLGGGGWPWYGTEIINNITTESTLISYRSGSSESQFNCSSCDQRRLEGNVLNAPGTLGMLSPKKQGATESDFSLTTSATLLIDQGRALHRRNGLPDVHAPTIDYRGVTRLQGAGPDLGAYEWEAFSVL
jgi:hypothetical protein